MSENVKMSIILVMYNSSLMSVSLTLKSILLQKFQSYEVIIADDGSSLEKKWRGEIEEIFSDFGKNNYCFAPSDTNLGTVQNILRALSLAHGKYIKVIGVGDIFIDQDALDYVYELMCREDVKCAFADMSGFFISEEKRIQGRYYNVPLRKKYYLNDDSDRAKKAIIVNCDYISGASMFFEKKCLEKYLLQLKECVKYAEDWIQVLMSLQDDKIVFFPKKIIAYEVGTGISTSSYTAHLLAKDRQCFNNYLTQKYSDNKWVKRRIERQEALKKGGVFKYLYILTKCPIYAIQEKSRSNNWFNKKEYLGFLEDEEFCKDLGIKSR